MKSAYGKTARPATQSQPEHQSPRRLLSLPPSCCMTSSPLPWDLEPAEMLPQRHCPAYRDSWRRQSWSICSGLYKISKWPQHFCFVQGQSLFFIFVFFCVCFYTVWRATLSGRNSRLVDSRLWAIYSTAVLDGVFQWQQHSARSKFNSPPAFWRCCCSAWLYSLQTLYKNVEDALWDLKPEPAVCSF